MKGCSRYLTAARQAVESDDEESKTSVIGHDHIHRTTGSDVTPNGDTHTKVEDNMSAEECTAEHNDEVSLMKQTSSHSGELRLSSKSGAVRKSQKGPIPAPTGSYQPGAAVERIPGNPGLHRPSDIRQRGAGGSSDT
jgi:hypothetical protein